MIEITVCLENDFGSTYNDVEITREELLQFACNKAKGMYEEGYYTNICALDSIFLKGTL